MLAYMFSLGNVGEDPQIIFIALMKPVARIAVPENSNPLAQDRRTKPCILIQYSSKATEILRTR